MLTLKRGTYLGSQTDTHHYKNIIISKTDYRQMENQNWHYHENSFFAYFLKGQNKELRRSNEIYCCPGTLLFYKAGEIHCNKDYSSGCRIFHLEIDKTWFVENNLVPYHIRDNEINNLFAKNIFINIIREFSIRDELSESSMQSLMLYLFNLLTRQSNRNESFPKWRFNIDKIMRQQAGIKDQSLTSIAKKLNIHPVTLSREFPKYYNCTFGEYVRQLRIEKAIPLLAKRSMPISDIAEYCSFSDTGNFIRCFKKLKGVTPGAYRKLL